MDLRGGARNLVRTISKTLQSCGRLVGLMTWTSGVMTRQKGQYHRKLNRRQIKMAWAIATVENIKTDTVDRLA